MGSSRSGGLQLAAVDGFAEDGRRVAAGQGQYRCAEQAQEQGKGQGFHDVPRLQAFGVSRNHARGEAVRDEVE